MDPASVVSLISFAGSCSNILGKTVKAVYQAPVEIISLQNELSDLKLLRIEYHALQSNAIGRGRASDTNTSSFEECLHKVQALFEELADLAAPLAVEKPNGIRQFKRRIWLKKKSAATRLQHALSTTRQNLRDLMSMNSESKLDRIEVKLESLNELVSNLSLLNVAAVDSGNPSGSNASAASVLQEDSSSRSGLPTRFTFTTYTRPECNLQCKCSCHYRFGLQTPSLAKAILGRLFIGYVGLPVLASV